MFTYSLIDDGIGVFIWSLLNSTSSMIVRLLRCSTNDRIASSIHNCSARNFLTLVWNWEQYRGVTSRNVLSLFQANA